MSDDLILIAGASSDIGQCLIRRIAAGSIKPKILAHYWNSEARVQELQSELGGDCIVPVRCDFSDEVSVAAMTEQIKMAHGVPNRIVFLPARKMVYQRFSAFDWSRFQSDLAMQLQSPVVMLRQFLPAMAKVKRGRVVFVSSIVTHGIPPKFVSAYTVAKYAQLGLMRALASEYAGTGVTVNAVSPGMVQTRFLEELPDLAVQIAASQNPRGRNLAPEEVVDAIQFMLFMESDHVTGVDLPIAGGAAV